MLDGNFVILFRKNGQLMLARGTAGTGGLESTVKLALLGSSPVPDNLAYAEGLMPNEENWQEGVPYHGKRPGEDDLPVTSQDTGYPS